MNKKQLLLCLLAIGMTAIPSLANSSHSSGQQDMLTLFQM